MMILVLAILATFAAALISLVVMAGNSMASSPQKFKGMGYIAVAWLGTAALWIAWGAS